VRRPSSQCGVGLTAWAGAVRGIDRGFACGPALGVIPHEPPAATTRDGCGGSGLAESRQDQCLRPSVRNRPLLLLGKSVNGRGPHHPEEDCRRQWPRLRLIGRAAARNSGPCVARPGVARPRNRETVRRRRRTRRGPNKVADAWVILNRSSSTTIGLWDAVPCRHARKIIQDSKWLRRKTRPILKSFCMVHSSLRRPSLL
jgi:hypothetical protein